jgi:putative glutamine amidotransferase
VTHPPLIGVTTALRRDDRNNIELLSAYERNIRALERAGALPVMIPCTLDDRTLRGIYERLDGVLIPGGGDINSENWDEALHPTAEPESVQRDHTELTIVRWAVQDDLPVFGICRGHQVVNVALGGSLVQDIPSMIDTRYRHQYSQPTPRSHIAHEITVEPSSKLAGILGGTRIEVNSIHHQSVKRIGEGMQVVAYAPDGIIEGTERPDKHFVVSVQWHPEDLTDTEPMFNLFRSFVEAASARMNGSGNGVSA